MQPALADRADPTVVPTSSLGTERITVRGKSFFLGARKHFVKGVTYGPFGVGSHGAQFPETATVERDFALMVEAGINTVRVFTPPPRWLLDRAAAHGLRLLIGLPWSQHIAFLDSSRERRRIRETVRDGVRQLAGHPATFAVLVGNEIPPDIVRWHGARPVGRFIDELYDVAKSADPKLLVSYANYPSTEYLNLEGLDFLAFNVYLHARQPFTRYLARLHNLAVDRPLVLSELGMDSMHHGADAQAQFLGWQVPTAFAEGVAGTFVFAWTDEWFTGGHSIENWTFGLVDRERRPKPAYAAVRQAFTAPLPPPLDAYPKVSVVICAYNAERTLDDCLASLKHLNYPNYEVILVNDGSTDATRAIAERHDFCRIINQENKGLSVARNVGAAAATGRIVAYTDSDCVADPDWLLYLVGKMQSGSLAAIGGPNFPPPEDALVPAAVAVSPGGPTHVLLSDDEAEHIAGCNMAFEKTVLEKVGMFDPVYRAAGDDVDLCWRLQNAGYRIGFSPAAVVWHYRRNTVSAYLQQQRGYGKAEALVYAKHPTRFNLFGQARWLGRIYGDLSAAFLFSRRPVIYAGVFGRGMFQTLYEPPSSLAAALPLTLEWVAVAAVLGLAGAAAGGWAWLGLLPIAATWTMCMAGAVKAPVDERFAGPRARALIALLIFLGPLLRGWERTRWRIRLLNGGEATPLETTAQPPKVAWAERALYLSYWTEAGIEKEALIAGVVDYLAPRKYFVQTDQGWDDWDLKIARGLWGRALIKVGTENHGGAKRLHRIRCQLRLSRLSHLLLRGYAILFVAALALDFPAAAIGVALVGLANLASILLQTAQLGRILTPVLERIGRSLNLTPAQNA
jgi:glycosyltransferase involved in cell wall biosynthesis